MSFRTNADNGCANSPYVLHMLTVVGAAEEDANQRNRKLLHDKIAELPGGRADYIVTIGTGVSRAAYGEFFGRVPLIFAGVTNPVASGLVKSYEPDVDRGPIAGVDYGLSHIERVKLFAKYLPGKRFGYVYNLQYNSDVVVRDMLLQESARLGVELVFIEVKEPRLNVWQQSMADIFLGHYYVTRNLSSFRASTSKPFIGGTNPDNLHNGSMMIIGNDDDRNIGAVAAKNVLLPNLLDNIQLHDIPVQRYTKTKIGINLAVFRQHDIAVPEALRKRADIVIDEAPQTTAQFKPKEAPLSKKARNLSMSVSGHANQKGHCLCPR
ncbi:MAG TPA: ABC transporter substrate binding protein [Pyrinomonadaceae bacterium]|nr:ABC transporter substrate binding protein [Pyrinomonadaceae bacterium]